MEKTGKLFDTKKSFVLFLVLMAFQMLIMCHWYSQRVNLYVDELYSLQYAHYETDPENRIVYLNREKAFEASSWVDMDALRDTMITGPEESVLGCSLFAAVKLLLKRKNYFFLLNLFNSTLSPNAVSTLPGFVLNLMLFPLLQLVLFATVKQLTGKKTAGFFGAVFYGFSCFVIDQTLYIRFYQWTVLLVSVAILLHLQMWERKNMKVSRFLLCELAALILLYLAFKNSEPVCVFGAFLTGLFVCALLIRGRRKQALLYALPIAAGVMYFVSSEKTIVNVMLHPEQYVGGASYAKDLVADSLLSLTWESFAEQMSVIGERLIKMQFFSLWMAVAAIALLCGMCLSVAKNNTGDGQKKDGGFFAVLAGTMLLYEIFLAMANCTAARYSAFGVYVFALLFSCICYAVFDLSRKKAWRRLFCLWLAVYAVLPFTDPSSVTLLYVSERSALSKASAYAEADVLLVTEDRHTLYDAVYNVGEGKRMLSISPSAETYDGPTDFAEELLVYCRSKKGFRESTFLGETLPSMGYKFEYLGRTHCSAIYYGYKE